MNSWQVFQADVLDVMRQYEGFFDFFERIGSMSDDSRPDCIARVTRDEKKEVWVVDAKNKPELEEDDRERMQSYVKRIKSNPVEVGLELSEIRDHEVRKLFVTSSGNVEEKDFEQLNFSELHSFLQKELVYTETDKVVRDVAKMVERKQLSQSQARLLFNSIKPFEKRLNTGIEQLEMLEKDFVGLELEKPPIESYEFKVPVDAVLRHRERDQVFIFDIPYSRDALEKIGEKVEQVKARLEEAEEPVFYTALNTFSDMESEYIRKPGEIRKELRETAAIISPETVAELFTPKVPVEKEYGDGYVEIKDTTGLGFRARVETRDDITHKVELVLPEEARSELSDHFLNANRIGRLKGDRLQHRIKVSEGLEIEYSGRSEPFESYRSSVEGMFRSAINPVLGRKVNQHV